MKGTPGLPLAGPLDGQSHMEYLIQITLSNPITGGLQLPHGGHPVCMVPWACIPGQDRSLIERLEDLYELHSRPVRDI